MQRLTIDPEQVEMPYEFECRNCNHYTFTFDTKKLRDAPWECDICNEVYIPCPDTVKNPSDIARRMLRRNMAVEVECEKCENRILRERFEESLMNLIETMSQTTDNHILYQVDRAEDMAFWECPSCGEPEDFLQIDQQH